ncbi:MAG TPA: ATPase, T2SS/T4P/T4SS family, partial [Actinotalea sp.]|nr:ATPase, T2SS/T4P/T4SS family [Actinotalea sp.]
GVPLLDLDAVNVDLEAVRLVNDKLLAKHRILPLFKRGKRLHVAVSDPTNLHAVDEVKFATGLSIEPVVVEDDKLQKAVQKALEQVDTAMPDLGGDDFDLENLDVTADDQVAAETVGRDDVEDAPIVRFVNLLVTQAISDRASDIHIEPAEHDLLVRYRIDGVLHEMQRAPKTIQSGVISRLKIMSDIDIAERRKPQDGRMSVVHQGRKIDLRVATLPTV